FLAVAGAGICFVSDERGSTLKIWRTPIAVRDLVFHSRGERTHQRTNADSQWGLISLPPEQLAACAKALTGLKITSPPAARVLRPSWSAAGPLRRLHSKVCPFAETRHELITHPEVARALEQELLHALVNCLTADDTNWKLKTRGYYSD